MNQKLIAIRSRTFLLLLLVLVSGCSTSRLPVKRIVHSIEALPEFEDAFVGLVVYDPEKQQVLLDHNGHKNFTPASNVKLLTFYAALKVLGDTIPHLKYLVKGDSLYISGTGDPSFFHPDFQIHVAEKFLQERTEEIFLLTPVTDPQPFGPGWAWEDYNAGYSAEKSAFPIAGNLVSFDLESKPIGVFPDIFSDSLVVAENVEEVKRDRYANRFSFPRNSNIEIQKVPFITSDETSSRLLSSLLNRPVGLATSAPEGSFQLLHSRQGFRLYKKMLIDSDNHIAEQILLMIASKVSDTLATRTAIEYIQQHYLEDLPNPVHWVDGSGLSRYNLVSPRNLVEILHRIKREIGIDAALSVLPAGGLSGTLKQRFSKGDTFVFAKTGSLSNNQSLSGYLRTKRGKILIFSFMVNHFTSPTSEVKDRMDQIISLIKNEY